VYYLENCSKIYKIGRKRKILQTN